MRNRYSVRPVIGIVLAVVVLGVLAVLPAPVAAQDAACAGGELGQPFYEQVTECRGEYITLVTYLSCCRLDAADSCILIGEVDATPTNELCEPVYAGPMAMIRYTGPAQLLNLLQSTGVQWCYKGTLLPQVIPVEAVLRTNDQLMASEWVPQADYPAINDDLNPANYRAIPAGGFHHCTQPLPGWYEWMRSHLAENGISLGGTAMYVP